MPSKKEEREATYSGKDKDYAYKYQVWSCFPSGRIIGIHGPFTAAYPDIHIYKATIAKELMEDEKVLADKAYQGIPSTITPIKNPRKTKTNPDPPDLPLPIKRYNMLVRVRRVHVERVFARMKRFEILKQHFRHPIEKHYFIMGAIAKMINIELQSEPLFKSEPSYVRFVGNVV